MRRVLLALALTLGVGAAGAAQAQTADDHPDSFWATPQGQAYLSLQMEANFLGSAVHCGIVGDAYSLVVGTMVSGQQSQNIFLSGHDYWEIWNDYVQAARGTATAPVSCSFFEDPSNGSANMVRQQVMSAQAYTFGN
jgi:hypothetical protein